VSLARLLNQTALVINRSQTGPVDEYGTPTWTESEFVTSCHVQPISTEEMAARPADRVRYRAWFPADTAIGASDRIVLASGLEAEVVGSALAWFNPRNRVESHLVVELADVSDEAVGGS
jgi:hypothetical protein